MFYPKFQVFRLLTEAGQEQELNNPQDLGFTQEIWDFPQYFGIYSRILGSMGGTINGLKVQSRILGYFTQILGFRLLTEAGQERDLNDPPHLGSMGGIIDGLKVQRRILGCFYPNLGF